MNVVSPRESLSVMIPALPPRPGPGHARKSAKPTSPLRAHRWLAQGLQMAVRLTSKLGSGGDQPELEPSQTQAAFSRKMPGTLQMGQS